METIIKQNNKKIIQCDRCGGTFCKLDNLRRHLKKKKTCEPILKDIPVAELIEKYKVRKGCYKCENCGKEYKSAVGKCKHKKKCLVNPIIIEKKENDKLKEELEFVKNEKDKEISKRKELEKQVEQLLLEKTQRNQENHIGVINNDNSQNTNINIVFNNYGEDTIEHLLKDENFFKSCMESPINSMHRYLEYVHFNKEHPENKNIKITNLLGPYMDYIKEGKWTKIEKNILIPKIIDKSIGTIDDIIDKKKEEIDNKEYSDDNIDYSKEDSDDDVIDYGAEDSDDDIINEIDDKKWKVYKSEINRKKIKNKIIKKANRQIYNETQDINTDINTD
jgi:hypothetical protein